jgi:hypothetical protein
MIHLLDFLQNCDFFRKPYLDKLFINIETGRVTEKLMNVNLDFLVAFCRKA